MTPTFNQTAAINHATTIVKLKTLESEYPQARALIDRMEAIEPTEDNLDALISLMADVEAFINTLPTE